MRIVAALGGNALLRPGEPLSAEEQRYNVQRAAATLAPLAREHELVITHGNGPQVGLLAEQSEAQSGVPAYPLDVLDAETEGMVGYLIDQALLNMLPGRQVATLLTQVVVDAADPAFATPTKPIGPWHDELAATVLRQQHGWQFLRRGGAYRRVVASPEPQRIVELETIERLVEAGTVVICAGGGGIPVVDDRGRGITGIEAVVDKDVVSALLASALDADVLLLLTDVPAIEAGWGQPDAHPLRRATPSELRALDLASGSMGPKAEAAARFVESTGGMAAVCSLDDAAAALSGQAGTTIVPDPVPIGRTA